METILLVEDEAHIAMRTARTLKGFGYDVVTVRTGEAAIAAAVKDEAINLVLMDIDLGNGMDGIEAAQRILAARHIPIVFLTAHMKADSVERVKAVTRYGYVIKNSGDFVLQSAIDMALALFNEHQKTRESERKFRRANRNLQERVKELNCVYKLARLVETYDHIDDIISELLYVLQQTWQYPKITAVRVTHAGRVFQTDNFCDTPWSQSAAIITDNETTGKIEIVYLEKRPEADEGPFLEEERSLLDTIAERLGRIIERLQTTHDYAQLFDTLNEAILKADVDGIIVAANRAAADLCGYAAPDALIGLPMTTLYVEPETREEIFNKLQEAGGELHNLEFLLKRRDGATVWTLCNIKLLRDRNGTISGTLGAIRDISERRKSEQALKESEEKYRRLFENSSSLIMEADADTFDVISCNPNMAAALGMTPEEIVGKKLNKLLPEDIFRNRVAYGEKALREKRPQTFEDERHGRHFLNTFIPVFSKGKRYVQTITYDITERRKAEEALRASEQRLQEAQHIAHIGSWDMNARTGDGVWSDELFRLLGYEPGDIAASYDLFRQHIHPDDVHKFEESITAYTSRVKHVDETFRFCTTHGEARIGHALGRVEFDEAGIPLRTYGTLQDITARKKAEKALKESEARLSYVLKSSKDIIIMQDLEGRYLYYNGLADFGLSSEDVLGKTSYDFFDKETADLMASQLQQVIKTGGSFVTEKSVNWQGQTLWFLDEIYPVFDAGEKLIATTLFSKNITKRKEVEQALRESETRANALLNAIPDMMFRLDRDGVYLDYKAAQSDLYASQEVAIIGSKCRDTVAPDLADQTEYFTQKALETGEIQIFEYQLPMPEKGLCDYEARMVPSGEDEVTVIVRDITERKKAEQQLRMYERITAIVNDPMSFVDTHYVYRTVNDAYTQFSNLPKEAIIGKTPAEVVGQEAFKQSIKPHLDRCFSGEEVHYQLWADSPAKGTRYMDMHYYPLFAEDGTVLGAVSQGHDMTAEKALEEQLRQANETKDMFFSIIAHDLRGPFISLESGTEILTKHFQDADDAYALRISRELYHSFTQLRKLLDNLLKWSRLQRGVLPFKPHTTDLYVAVGYIMNLLDTSTKQKHIEVRHSIQRGTHVYADYDMLQTILRNLIANAIKFTPEGGTITVAAEEKADVIAISVTDNGVGISADKLLCLFEMGKKRISSRGTRGEKGTGLGLILCKEFVEKHGGEIWVESEEGQGSTFTFTLPKPT